MIKLDRNMSGWINQTILSHFIDLNFKPKYDKCDGPQMNTIKSYEVVGVGHPLWGEGMCLSFTFAAGPRQRSHSRVRDTQTWRARSKYLYPPGRGWPNYTPRHWAPFLSPPTTRRAVVEAFKPPPCMGRTPGTNWPCLWHLGNDRVENTAFQLLHFCVHICWWDHFLAMAVFAEPFPIYGCLCWLRKYATINSWYLLPRVPSFSFCT
jgi:hypothetical protein